MTHIMLLLERLDLTGTLTTTGHIRASVHSVQSGLSIRGPVSPRILSGYAEDSAGSSTVHSGGIEVQPATYFGDGC